MKKIQWCDSAVTPVIGCRGCELYPTPAQLVRSLKENAVSNGITLDSDLLLKSMIAEDHPRIPGLPLLRISHLVSDFTYFHGKAAGKAFAELLKSPIKNREPERTPVKGYAPTFNQLTKFESRLVTAAGLSDLQGTPRPGSPWKDGLPRMIYSRDMGDFMSLRKMLPFLRQQVLHIFRGKGRRHLWLLLTDASHIMRHFAEEIGGLPGNACAMTTVTGPDALHRVDELRQTKAVCRGLSIEPLWERIPPESLDLTGIDWLILGGESGGTRTFDLAWAEELHAHCRKNGTAFFLKQLGRNPVLNGEAMRLKDPHGGDWSEWPEHLRVREFPEHFRRYRQTERSRRAPRPAHV